MNKLELIEKLKNMNACEEGLEWAESCETIEEMYRHIPILDFLTLAHELGLETELRLFAVALIREIEIHDGKTGIEYLDASHREALEIAERYARNSASFDELLSQYRLSLAVNPEHELYDLHKAVYYACDPQAYWSAYNALVHIGRFYVDYPARGAITWLIEFMEQARIILKRIIPYDALLARLEAYG